jgi:hypothetical protein
MSFYDIIDYKWKTNNEDFTKNDFLYIVRYDIEKKNIKKITRIYFEEDEYTYEYLQKIIDWEFKIFKGCDINAFIK